MKFLKFCLACFLLAGCSNYNPTDDTANTADVENQGNAEQGMSAPSANPDNSVVFDGDDTCVSGSHSDGGCQPYPGPCQVDFISEANGEVLERRIYTYVNGVRATREPI